MTQMTAAEMREYAYLKRRGALNKRAATLDRDLATITNAHDRESLQQRLTMTNEERRLVEQSHKDQR